MLEAGSLFTGKLIIGENVGPVLVGEPISSFIRLRPLSGCILIKGGTSEVRALDLRTFVELEVVGPPYCGYILMGRL